MLRDTLQSYLLVGAAQVIEEATHNSIGKPPYLPLRVDPWAFLVIPRTYFRANIPDDEGGFVLAYNLMMFAIVAVCVPVIHLAFDERQRREVKRRFANLIASLEKEWRG
jgi:hypothetical protein